MSRCLPCALLALALLLPGGAQARDGRLLATGGATQVEGSAGGGIVPWAVLAGYGTRDQDGGTAFYSRVDTGDYALDAYGVAYTFRNRLELSLARQRFDLGELQRRLSLPWNALEQDIFGAKLRLGGDLVYTAWPQFSLGVQHKRLRDGALPLAIGARYDQGTDVYLSASKLFLAGPGGRQLLDPSWVVGVEYRQKPDNLGFAGEDAWMDAFVAWFPNKHVAVVAAWADLGSIATLDGQRGAYLSLQLSY